MPVDTTPNGYPVQVITIGDHIGKACLDTILCPAQMMSSKDCAGINGQVD